MARLARIVVPGVAHHVTQRGNRRQDVFFGEEDYAVYRRLVADACAAHGVSCLAWCLMPNHVHLILTPTDPDGLRAALGEAHRRYSAGVNAAREWTGYLFQGRFASYPMDEAHRMAAIRYVELNPVRAGVADHADDWPWSSARAHLTGRADGLTDLAAMKGVHRNWRAMLRRGLEAADTEEGDEAEDRAAIEASLRTGRPWGEREFVEELEAKTGRTLARRKPGRKPARERVI